MKLKTKKTDRFVTITGSPHLEALASEVFKNLKEIKRRRDKLALDKADLCAEVAPHFYEELSADKDLRTVKVMGEDGSVLVTQKMQTTDDLDPIKIAKIAGDKFPRWFEHVSVIGVNSALIPKAKRVKILTEIVALMKKHGCHEAVSLERKFQPTETFWEERHTLSVSTNLKLDTVVPPIRSLKTV